MTRYAKKTALSIPLIILLLFIMICNAETPSTIETKNSNVPGDIFAQTNKYININKEILPEKELYFPRDNIYVFTEIKFSFFSDRYWYLKNLLIFEIVDEKLRVDNNSIKCAIISNVADENIYRHNPDIKIVNPKINITNKNNSFFISIPKLSAPQRVIYWYKVTVNEPGNFAADTSVRPGPNSSFYQDMEQSLKIQVSSYYLLDRYLALILLIISILVGITGIFTFIKDYKRKDYHLINLLGGIRAELTDFVKKISYKWIILFLLLIFVPFLYSYLSSINRDWIPDWIPSIDYIFYQYSRYIFEALSGLILIIILGYRLNLDYQILEKSKMKIDGIYYDFIYYVKDMPNKIKQLIRWILDSRVFRVIFVAIACTFPLFMLLISYLANYIFR